MTSNDTPQFADTYDGEGSAYGWVKFSPIRQFVEIEADGKNDSIRFDSAAARDVAAMLLDAADRLDPITDTATTGEVAA